jgi:hypothetical protein
MARFFPACTFTLLPRKNSAGDICSPWRGICRTLARIEFPGESVTREIDRAYLPKPNYTPARPPGLPPSILPAVSFSRLVGLIYDRRDK